MKINVIITIILVATQIHSFAQDPNFIRDDSLVVNELMKIKLKKFTEKPVEILLNSIKLRQREIQFVQSKPASIGWARVIYTDNVWLDVYIEKFKIMERELDEGETPDIWKEVDFRKEIVSKIRVVKNSKILKEYPKKPELPNF